MTKAATADAAEAQARPNDDPRVMSYRTMRLWIGILGLALPVIVLAGATATEGCLRSSISAYYHSDNPLLHGTFVGILCAMGFYLIAYRGYAPGRNEWISDDRLCDVIGVAAIVVAILPTSEYVFAAPPDGGLACAKLEKVTGEITGWLLPVHWLDELHFVGAGAFMVLTAVLVGGFFTRTEPVWQEDETGKRYFDERKRIAPDDIGKRCRNAVFALCSGGMLACVVLIGIEALVLDPAGPLTAMRWVFEPLWIFEWLPVPVLWFEAVAVFLLAIAWLVKALGSTPAT